MIKAIIVSSMITLMILVGPPAIKSADNLTLGQQAEQAGNLSQALSHYVEALKADENNQQLREKIIKLAQRIQPPLEVPEEAERQLVRGSAAVKAAKDEQGYVRAAREFQQALVVAPWLAAAYFNLGVVQDRAGQYEDAIRNLRFYLVAMPDDKEAKNLIYEIEYRQEEEQRVKSVRNLEGRWIATFRTQNWTEYDIYNVSVTGENSLTIEYTKTKYDPRPSWCKNEYTMLSNNWVIKATLANLQIQGTLTTWVTDDGSGSINPDALRPQECPVTGELSQDGNCITLKTATSMAGSTKDSYGGFTIVLQKSGR